MSTDFGREQGLQNIQGDWEAVGRYITTAMQEVALGIGGEELADRVALAAVSDDVFPDVAALRILEDLQPGSVELVLTRASEIQDEAHQREIAALHSQRPRRYGRTLLEGLTSFNIFGRQTRER